MKHLIILLSLISSVCFGQTVSLDKDKKLSVVITGKQNNSTDIGTEGYTITLLKDSVVKSTVTQNPGKLDLDLDGNYSIVVSKKGYNSKSICLKTSGISIPRWNKGFEPLEIEAILFKPEESTYTTTKCYIYTKDEDEFMPY